MKEQSARDFIADDGSGGKSSINEVLAKAPEPIMDAVAWDLGLGVGDQKYHFRDTRVERTKWLYPQDSKPDDPALVKAIEPGKHDLFKLMIWDLLLEAVKERARGEWAEGPEHWDTTFEALRNSLSHSPSVVEHLSKIAKKIVEAGGPDVLVLVEASSNILKGDNPEVLRYIISAEGPKYRLLRPNPEHMDDTSNVAILLREEVFPKFQMQPFVDQENKLLGRAMGAILTDIDGEELQILALHLPSNGYNIPAVCGEVEKRLAVPMPTIVAGDLNLDIRVAKAKNKIVADRPLLAKLVETSKHTWDQPKERGSVNKRRTAFQAQVSKINLEDFSVKDTILVPTAGLGEISGLISRSEQLPSADCPSDHVLLCWRSPKWPSRLQ